MKKVIQEASYEVPREYDYPELRKQTGDFISTFYGPHACGGCGRLIVKQALEHGAASWEGNKIAYSPHHCTHVALFKRLAGRILTVLDASLSANPSQHKAVKDLVKEEFAQIISRAREMEGDKCGEANGSLEQLVAPVLSTL